jgi:hypothetical protein
MVGENGGHWRGFAWKEGMNECWMKERSRGEGVAIEKKKKKGRGKRVH